MKDTLTVFSVALATSKTLPPPPGFYQYLVAANGLFLHAEDSRMEALVYLAGTNDLPGLVNLEPFVRLKAPKVPPTFLDSVLDSARRHLPNECAYQFTCYMSEEWKEDTWIHFQWNCRMPPQAGTPTALTFDDLPGAVIDLHSHNVMPAFFSSTDDRDEQGLRFYCVIGKVDTETPEILCRVGVYGHHMLVPVETIFESAGPFLDRFGEEPDPEIVTEIDLDREELNIILHKNIEGD